MEDAGGAQSGQHDVGCEASTSITRLCSVIWICSTCLPSGRASRAATSIMDSLSREHTRLDETISPFTDTSHRQRAENPKNGHEPSISTNNTCPLYDVLKAIFSIHTMSDESSDENRICKYTV